MSPEEYMSYPHQYIKLSEEEQKRITRELQNFAIKWKFRKRRRLQAVWLSHSGLTYQEISKRLGITYRSVKQWLSTYRKKGIEPFL